MFNESSQGSKAASLSSSTNKEITKDVTDMNDDDE